jgi:hypothetical protein
MASRKTKAASKSEAAPEPQADLKEHAAAVLGIDEKDVLGVRQTDEGLSVVTAQGQKALLNDEGVSFVAGPQVAVEGFAAEAPLPESPKEEPGELPPLEDEDAGKADPAE